MLTICLRKDLTNFIDLLVRLLTFRDGKRKLSNPTLFLTPSSPKDNSQTTPLLALVKTNMNDKNNETNRRRRSSNNNNNNKNNNNDNNNNKNSNNYTIK